MSGLGSIGGGTVGLQGGNNLNINSHQMQQQQVPHSWNTGPAPSPSGPVSTASSQILGTNQNLPNQLNGQIDAINMQQSTLREQIIQSEQNLSAQHGVIITSKLTLFLGTHWIVGRII